MKQLGENDQQNVFPKAWKSVFGMTYSDLTDIRETTFLFVMLSSHRKLNEHTSSTWQGKQAVTGNPACQ